MYSYRRHYIFLYVFVYKSALEERGATSDEPTLWRLNLLFLCEQRDNVGFLICIFYIKKIYFIISTHFLEEQKKGGARTSLAYTYKNDNQLLCTYTSIRACIFVFSTFFSAIVNVLVVYTENTLHTRTHALLFYLRATVHIKDSKRRWKAQRLLLPLSFGIEADTYSQSHVNTFIKERSLHFVCSRPKRKTADPQNCGFPIHTYVKKERRRDKKREPI